MIKVDQSKCIGCGMCAGICPAVFQMGEDGKSKVFSQDDPGCADDAAAACPVDAISL